MIEENFRRSMLIGQGRLQIFVERPICLALLLVAIVVAASLPAISAQREKVLE